MFKKAISCLVFVVTGFFSISCDKSELEEVGGPKAATSQIAASADMVVEETFEGASPLSAFHAQEFGTAHAFALVSNPAFEGRKAARFELQDTDPMVKNGTRAEVTVVKDKVQKEMWYSFAVYLPAADFAYDSQKEIIAQWHQQSGASAPSFLEIQKDRFAFGVASKADRHMRFDLGQAAKNKWHQFTFHYIHSNGSDGLVEIWHNGKKVFTHQGGNMYALNNFPKWKVGIYKWKWNEGETTDVSKRVLYFDNIRVGAARLSRSESIQAAVPSDYEEPGSGGGVPADYEEPGSGGGVPADYEE